MPAFWSIPFLGGPLDGEQIEVPFGLSLPSVLTANDELNPEQDGRYNLSMEHEQSPHFEGDPLKYVWTPDPKF